ncbi:MAG: type II toxin-antitoxin system Phd/YefM family antitoxin [Deltaproteobacteria bacterium]|nr:type II toxin-antitoxin system Phd/YefM family antitoxin [Deltaproteobacteria bacterium]
MLQINVFEAKTNLSRLLLRVAAGEEVIIARAGKPVAKLVPFQKQATTRVLGQDSGLVTIADDFDAPLSEDVLEEFER